MTRATIVGCGTSSPQPGTPASGVLIETASIGLLVDCGPGVIRDLMAIRDPRGLDAILVGHLHADHFIDLVSLRYLMPWANYTGRRIPVLLPPGGIRRMTELAAAISERAGFFDDTFEIVEYDPAGVLTIGDLTIEFIAGRHYIPSWGFLIQDQAGRRIVISGDTGPNETLVETARGADLFIVEATLLTADEDDPVRGHLTLDEALDLGGRAGAERTVLVHYPTERYETISAACQSRSGSVLAEPGLTFELDRPAVRRADTPSSDQTEGAMASGIASSAARAR